MRWNLTGLIHPVKCLLVDIIRAWCLAFAKCADNCHFGVTPVFSWWRWALSRSDISGVSRLEANYQESADSCLEVVSCLWAVCWKWEYFSSQHFGQSSHTGFVHCSDEPEIVFFPLKTENTDCQKISIVLPSAVSPPSKLYQKEQENLVRDLETIEEVHADVTERQGNKDQPETPRIALERNITKRRHNGPGWENQTKGPQPQNKSGKIKQ